MADFYSTCATCLVKDWCKRKSGESPLPADYLYNPECSGYLRISRAQQLSGIPSEYLNATRRNLVFDTDNQHIEEPLIQTLDNIVNAVERGTNIAFMHPNTGTGKTHISCTIINEYILKTCMTDLFDYEHALGYYVKYGKWANDLRQQYQLKDADYTYKVMKDFKRMQRVPLLVIDDIGSGRITDYIRDITYDLIDYRKENKLSTIFTTNLTMQQLDSVEVLGSRVTSRLHYNTIVYTLGGRDRRKERTIFI